MFVAVLWGGTFIKWVELLTRNRINLRVLTDCRLNNFLFRFGRHYSSMLLVLMSIEKCIALYFPLRANKYCTVKTAKYVTGIVGIILCGYYFQYLFVYKAIVDEEMYVSIYVPINFVLFRFCSLLLSSFHFNVCN